MSTSSILDVIPDGQKYPYATPEQPNKLSDYDLQFLSLYTGQKDLDKLREHVLKVWRSLKDQVQFILVFTPAHPCCRECCIGV